MARLGDPYTLSLWNIWLARNNNTFNNKMKVVVTNATISQDREYNLIKKKERELGAIKSTTRVKWEPLDNYTYKHNVDVSVKHTPRQGGLSGVFGNHFGSWLVNFTEFTPHKPSQSWFHDILTLLNLEIQHNLNPLEINFDRVEHVKILTYHNLLYDQILVEWRSLILRKQISKL